MKIITLFSIFFIIIVGIFVSFVTAQALVAQMAPIPLLGIGLFELFVVLVLFFFIPIAFFGMILRMIGFKRDMKTGSWKWSFKKASFLFLKYFIYHVLFWGCLFLVLILLTAENLISISILKFLFFPFSPMIVYFLIYSVIWAFIGPYAVYFWHKIIKKPTLRPGIWLHVRLMIWNLCVFLLISLVIHYGSNLLPTVPLE